MDPLVAAALEALRTALAKSQGRRPAFLQLLYPDGTADLLPLSSPILPENTSSRPATNVNRLSEMEETVLGVLLRAEKPLKGSAIASRAGVRYSSHIRQVLSELVQKGKLIRAPQGGYWPADRPLPTG
jgi:hypothetical protein